MDINSELRDAQLEIKDSDNAYSVNKKGLIWFNRATDKIKAIFNGTVEILATESYVSTAVLEGALYPVGEVKLAMLSEAQFQTTYSSNWLAMNGQVLLASNYPVLASLRPEWVSLGNITLPVGDTFLRMNTARAIGSYEADEFKSHNHGGGGHTHYALSNTISGGAVSSSRPYIALSSGASTNNDDYYLNGASSPAPTLGVTSNSGTIISTNGGLETRPKNIAISAFIKVK